MKLNGLSFARLKKAPLLDAIQWFAPFAKNSFYVPLLLFTCASATEGLGVFSILPLVSNDPKVFLEYLDGVEFINQTIKKDFIRDNLNFIIPGLLLLVTVLSKALLSYGANLKLALSRQLVLQNLKSLSFRAALSSPLDYIVKIGPGSISSIINEQVNRLGLGYFLTIQVMGKVLTTLIYLAIAVAASPSVGLVCLFLIALFYPILNYMEGMVSSSAKNFAETNNSLSRKVSSFITNIRMIKSFSKEDYIGDQVQSDFESLAKSQLDIARVTAITGSIREPAALLALLFLSFFEILVLGNSAEYFLVSAFALFRAVSTIFSIMAVLQQAKEYMGGLPLLLDIMAISKAYWGPTVGDCSPMPTNKIIRFNNVSKFYTHSSNTVVSDVNIEIKAGSFVGIVGASGSGKSTLLDMLMGLSEPSTGSVTIDGYSPRDLGLVVWRRNFGYVQQSNLMIADTLLHNISFSGLGADSERAIADRVAQVIDSLGMEDILDKLPQREQTMLGEGGLELSGGQKQRICIARAIYKNPPVLVLDEVTSALDPRSQEIIMKTVLALKGKKTIVMVTHQPSLLAEADKIYEIKDGAVVAVR